MINQVILVGRLVRDVDLKYTPNGVAVANFTIATNRPFTNNTGDREADFINCVTWRKTAENLANFMTKGSLIGIVGRIQTRFYDGEDGKRVYVTEVVAENIQFLDSKDRRSDTEKQHEQEIENNNNINAALDPIDISDDDMPF